MGNKELPEGIRRTARGFQAYVWVVDHTHPKGGFQASKRFPPDTAISVMKRWRETRRLRLDAPEPAGPGFDEDAGAYLETVATMPSYQDREKHIHDWIAVFGHRPRRSIASWEIDAQLQAWLAQGYAASSVRHRRTALMHLWSKLDGRSAPNPVKDTARPVSDDGAPRWVPPDLAEAFFTQIRRGATRARLMLIRWSGIPHTQLEQIRPEHIDWTLGGVWVSRRRKGKGAKARMVPLLPPAIDALREMKRYDAFGAFSRRSMRVTLERARRALVKQLEAGTLKLSPESAALLRKDTKGERVRPYDFRHTFGTMLRFLTPDAKARQQFMLHSDPRQTARYEEAAADPMLVTVRDAVAKTLRATGKWGGARGRVTGRSLNLGQPRKPAVPRKGRNSAKTLPLARKRLKSA